MFVILLIVLTPLVWAETDKVCIGMHTGPETAKVDSLSRKGVPVTGHIDLTASNMTGKFCKFNGVSGRSTLDTTGSCSNAEVLMMAACTTQIPTASYHVKKPFSMQRCFPMTVESVERFNRFTDWVVGYSQISQTTIFTGVAGDWGSYTAGTSGSCAYGGANGFFDSVHWLVPVTKGVVSPANHRTVKNDNCEKMAIIWGMFQADQSTTMNNIYGVVEDQVTVTTAEQTQVVESRVGPFPAADSGNPTVAQVSRMEMRYVILSKGESAVFTYGQAFIAPKMAWCLNKKIPVFEASSLPMVDNCDTSCVSANGSLEKKSPFQTVTNKYAGDCPVYSPVPLLLANGTETKMVIEPRGLFGAIAGFLEGGWTGMVNGWYGYNSQSQSGSGVAADYKSTQKAIDKITAGLNSLTGFVNKNFNRTFNALQSLEKEIGEVDDKVNDLRADVFAFQLKQLILMENERILDSHDHHLAELKTETAKMLGPSAKDLMNGCFEIQHKCDQICLNSLKNRNYSDKAFLPQPLIDQIYLGKVPLTVNEKGWQDPLLIVDSCIIALLFVAGLMAAVKWAMNNGSLKCNICI